MTIRTKTARRGLALSAALCAALVVPAAQGNAQTAQSNATRAAAPQPVRSISAQDRAQGAKANPDLIAEFGGAMTGPQATYVESIGKNIAVQSGLSNARGDFTVTLLNSPINNAFAIPGGYIYVTRELVALMNNEAELAGVLGHEVGHVAARHSAKRQSAATRNTIIGVLGSVLTGAVLGDSGVGNFLQKGLAQGTQLLTLRYSRSQETEADNLGISYLQRAGYDPRAMSSVLQSLANQNVLEARLMGNSAGQVPEWASTHPDPASRVRTALNRAGGNATGITNRDTFLARIDGLTYGDDPRQGVVDGRRFAHPDFGLTFTAPAGFALTNGSRAVSISGQSGKGEFSNAAYNGDLDAYVRAVFAAAGQGGNQQLAPAAIQRTTVNGIPAAYGVARAQGQSGQLDLVVFAYEFARGKAYHFLTISQAGSAGALDPMFQSVRRLSASEAAAIRPRRLSVVTARGGDTIQTLAGRMAYTDAQLERFLVLNGLTASSRIVAGQKVKLVVY